MKLLTEMQDGCVHSGGCCIDTEDASPLTVARLEHDAACAHALMQALEEYESAEDGQANIIAALIKRRASAIFSEWGFDSGEVDGGL